MGSQAADLGVGPGRAMPVNRDLRASLWFLGSIVLTTAAFPPALVVADSLRPDFGPDANVVFFTAGSLTWLLLSLAGAIVLARLLSLGPVGDARTVVLVVASVLSGTFICLAYGAWTEVGYGNSDPDNLGIGILVPAATVLCALYAALSVVTIRPASLVSLAVSALAFGAIVLIGVLNLPGLRDGLSVEGLLMVVACIALGAVLARMAVDNRGREA
jgi:hypothetical protein